MQREYGQSLLTPADLVCVEEATVPSRADSGLVQRTADDRAIFTVRGLQLYRAVCAKHGLEQELRAVDTWDEYAALKLKILSRSALAAESNLRTALARGEVPVQARRAAEAALRGDLAEALAANAEWHQCAEAGPNVVPLGAAKK